MTQYKEEIVILVSTLLATNSYQASLKSLVVYAKSDTIIDAKHPSRLIAHRLRCIYADRIRTPEPRSGLVCLPRFPRGSACDAFRAPLLLSADVAAAESTVRMERRNRSWMEPRRPQGCYLRCHHSRRNDLWGMCSELEENSGKSRGG
ncbi:uncharacterized protein LOC104452805 [Eucalyptus grandis]|uniref:uncharacterized protein LOC104452805 n=1 Tax=Eucalyptus grandis TaxID=71139 RepID=UPI00192ECEAB|nr:uncharacterized protein LOC104452805 [Eucalyptus grandis]